MTSTRSNPFASTRSNPFASVGRVLASDAVHAQLRGAILSGVLAPGSLLPSERELAERMGVHRGAIREAIKRLQQARLVAVAHGGGTRVLNWRETGGVEILPDLVKGIAEEPAPDVVQSVLEARRGIGIDIARLCAQRATSGFAARLHDRLDRDPDTEDTQLNAYLDLWELITHGSDNIAYQLIFRSVRDALEPLGDIIAPLLADETSDTITQRALIDAIAQRKPERAASIADELLSRTLENLQQHPNIAPSPVKKS